MIEWFARHQTGANLLMSAIIILGLVSVGTLQRETFPEIESDEVEVRVVYQGATPQEVEDAVCRRLEDTLESISDLKELRCESREGIGTATAVMREGGAMVRFLDDVKSGVDAIDDLPEQTEAPVVSELRRTERVISVAVTGPQDPLALKAYTEDLKDRMMALTDISEVTVAGFSDHHIRVEVPAWRLRQYGLSAADIANTLGRQNVSSPAGHLQGGTEDVLLRFDHRRKRADAFHDLVVISGDAGAAIRLGEIAQITDRFDRDEEKIFFNGKRAGILNISKNPLRRCADGARRSAHLYRQRTSAYCSRGQSVLNPGPCLGRPRSAGNVDPQWSPRSGLGVLGVVAVFWSSLQLLGNHGIASSISRCLLSLTHHGNHHQHDLHGRVVDRCGADDG